MVERFELAKNYSICRVINGCWQLSLGHSLKSSLDEEDIMKAFHMLVEKGFTTFDCADIYTGAEEFLGRFGEQLKSSSAFSPKDIQIHTKYVPDINLLESLDFNYTESIIDRSLKRLKREALDLVQFHWWDYEVEGSVDTAMHLNRLKEKGKIKNISVTNFDAEELSKIVEAGIDIISCQTQYSVLDRRAEKGFVEYCMDKGINQLCYGVIAGGFLAEKWLDKKAPTSFDNRSIIKYLLIIEESMGWDKFQQLLHLLKNIADKYDVEIPHIATRYILNKEDVSAVIVGTRNSKHVESNEKIFSFFLNEDDIKKIDDFLIEIPIISGEPFELERTVGSKFRSIMKMNITETEK